MYIVNKHTPGPWAFSKSDMFGDLRFYVAQSDAAPYTPNFSDVTTLIAETVPSERQYIQEANARLIAAAPELLEALHVIVDAFDSLPPTHEARYAHLKINTARAAIAKATGEVK
jgi:hypothetical protein